MKQSTRGDPEEIFPIGDSRFFIFCFTVTHVTLYCTQYSTYDLPDASIRTGNCEGIVLKGKCGEIDSSMIENPVLYSTEHRFTEHNRFDHVFDETRK